MDMDMYMCMHSVTARVAVAARPPRVKNKLTRVSILKLLKIYRTAITHEALGDGPPIDRACCVRE